MNNTGIDSAGSAHVPMVIDNGGTDGASTVARAGSTSSSQGVAGGMAGLLPSTVIDLRDVSHSIHPMDQLEVMVDMNHTREEILDSMVVCWFGQQEKDLQGGIFNANLLRLEPKDKLSKLVRYLGGSTAGGVKPMRDWIKAMALEYVRANPGVFDQARIERAQMNRAAAAAAPSVAGNGGRQKERSSRAAVSEGSPSAPSFRRSDRIKTVPVPAGVGSSMTTSAGPATAREALDAYKDLEEEVEVVRASTHSSSGTSKGRQGDGGRQGVASPPHRKDAVHKKKSKPASDSESSSSSDDTSTGSSDPDSDGDDSDDESATEDSSTGTDSEDTESTASGGSAASGERRRKRRRSHRHSTRSGGRRHRHRHHHHRGRGLRGPLARAFIKNALRGHSSTHKLYDVYSNDVEFRHERNRNEVLALCEVADLLRQNRKKKAMEVLIRRLAGVQTADSSNNWAACDAIEVRMNKQSFIPARMLGEVFKASKRAAMLSAPATRTSAPPVSSAGTPLRPPIVNNRRAGPARRPVTRPANPPRVSFNDGGRPSSTRGDAPRGGN